MLASLLLIIFACSWVSCFTRLLRKELLGNNVVAQQEYFTRIIQNKEFDWNAFMEVGRVSDFVPPKRLVVLAIVSFLFALVKISILYWMAKGLSVVIE